jgi:probable rRNA maturation factor
MIEVTNEQHTIDVHIENLKKDAQYLLGLLEYSDFDLGIVLADPKKIQAFNKEFRDKDTVTDILSFAYYPDLKPGERIVLPSKDPDNQDEKYLGDIVICPEFVKSDLPNWQQQTFEQRMQALLAHGLCHLLGYTHDTPENEKAMQEKETALLEKLLAHRE